MDFRLVRPLAAAAAIGAELSFSAAGFPFLLRIRLESEKRRLRPAGRPDAPALASGAALGDEKEESAGFICKGDKHAALSSAISAVEGVVVSDTIASVGETILRPFSGVPKLFPGGSAPVLERERCSCTVDNCERLSTKDTSSSDSESSSAIRREAFCNKFSLALFKFRKKRS